MALAHTIVSAQPEVTPQDRLLDAATALFADTGYENTSVRNIVALAGTNLNAVNYYFGGKQNLYLEVLRREMRRARAHQAAANSPLADPGPSAAPQRRLRVFVHRLLTTFIDPASNLPRLSALEIMAPSPVFDQLSPLLHEGEQHVLHDIVAALIAGQGGVADEGLVQRCARSVLSQCTHFLFMRQVLPRVEPALVKDDAALAALADHITAFSVAAISALGAAAPANHTNPST